MKLLIVDDEELTRTGVISSLDWSSLGIDEVIQADDGVGISPEKLPTILSGNGTSTSGGTNIAIYNTHRRLQILYGSDYGLTYSSKPGHGTEVEIRIPAKKETA